MAKTITLSSVLLNFYSWIIWIVAFQSFTTQSERLDFYLDFFPLHDGFTIAVLGLLLTIVSLFLLMWYDVINRTITRILLAVQGVFLILNFTQLL